MRFHQAWTIAIVVLISVLIGTVVGTLTHDAPQVFSISSETNLQASCGKDNRQWIAGSVVRDSSTDNFPFNVLAFGYSLVAGGFLLGMHRWRLNRADETINEMFEGRRQLNMMLINKEHRPMTSLVSAATGYEKVGNNGADATEEQFMKKMYVYMEMDILEFAYLKYEKMLIDDIHAWRACSIFWSRLINKEFETLATNCITQGNYGEQFRLAVESVIKLHKGEDEAKPKGTSVGRGRLLRILRKVAVQAKGCLKAMKLKLHSADQMHTPKDEKPIQKDPSVDSAKAFEIEDDRS